MPVNPAIELTFSITAPVSHVLILNFFGTAYDIAVSDGAACVAASGNTVLTNAVNTFDCNNDVTSTKVTLDVIDSVSDMELNKVIILSDTCGVYAADFYYSAALPIVIEYENNDQLEVRIPYISIEVVPNCFELDYATASLFMHNDLTTPFPSSSISLDLDTNEIVILNADLTYENTNSFDFSVQANDIRGTWVETPLYY